MSFRIHVSAISCLHPVFSESCHSKRMLAMVFSSSCSIVLLNRLFCFAATLPILTQPEISVRNLLHPESDTYLFLFCGIFCWWLVRSAASLGLSSLSLVLSSVNWAWNARCFLSFFACNSLVFFPRRSDVLLLGVYRKKYMARFVDDESKNKRGGQGMDVSNWPRFNYGNVPRQRNGLDCGEPALVLT